MSVSVAPRDTMVSTDLSVPPMPSSRWLRFVAAVRHLVMPVASDACSHCEIGVVSGPHHDMTYLDTLAREHPYDYVMSIHV